MAGRLTTLKDVKGERDDDRKADGKAGNTLYTGGAASGLNVIGRPEEGANSNAVASRVFARSGEAVGGKGVVVIKFWRNGFTVDDEDVRSPDDPANAEFLRALDEGRVPRELQRRLGMEDKEIEFEDHRGEDWVAPPYRAFRGTSERAGGIAAPAAAHAHTRTPEAAAAAAASVVVDASKPTTDIRVRMADGRTEKVTLNLTHTVGDLQARVGALTHTHTHGKAAKAFVLLAGFPPRPLDDASKTVEAAGLKGAMVTQQLV